MIVTVRDGNTGSTETFNNVERINSNTNISGIAVFVISLTDRSKHYYPAHIYSYEVVDGIGGV
jgi:hypothetical protein